MAAHRNPCANYTKEYEHENMGAISVICYSRLYFPKFDDDNQVEWRRQCEKCLEMAATPDEYKLALDQLYIIGRADVWLRR